ncbi:MAG TPA: flagellar export protein FliJ [Planctomycetes bacterium]|nr:flagellar export protein FliJ [Planctomycetota bacterium]HIN79455.1 flagellar export protein FliJ [Planctomycetota bacterium]
MSNKTFALEGLLKLRQLKKDQAVQELRSQASGLTKAQDELAGIDGEIADISNRWKDSGEEVRGAEGMIESRQYLARLDRLGDSHREGIAKLILEIEDARKKLDVAMHQHQVVERMKNRLVRVRRQRRESREVQALDEQSQSRHRGNQEE